MDFVDKIFNEDCRKTMQNMYLDGFSFNLVLTSPPYNTSRPGTSLSHACANIRYDEFNDCRSNREYLDWSIQIFRLFDKCLSENGCILYNLSYSSENIDKAEMMWLLIAEIIKLTNFTVADCIIWKKTCTSPNSTSMNKLTRICELVFVFCRKNEFKTFNANKPVTSIRHNGQKNYKNIFNYIEAANNDRIFTDIHRATFSTELVQKLLMIYACPGSIIYDPFIGTGTTAVGCVKQKLHYVGSEISTNYCKIANEKISNEENQLTLF